MISDTRQKCYSLLLHDWDCRPVEVKRNFFGAAFHRYRVFLSFNVNSAQKQADFSLKQIIGGCGAAAFIIWGSIGYGIVRFIIHYI
ncbi:MAG: hypothetical protein LBH61_07785 [Dysgonamonadaceae bacterium]|jgi:hypothetical protein|nr:hypothetical protein [Dysgonamonadaceae bacterium]